MRRGIQWIVIADSNVLMPRDYLHRLLSRWSDDTGVVCSMPIGVRIAKVWAELECAFLNTLQARYQYFSESLGFGFAQGKSMLFRRDVSNAPAGSAPWRRRMPRTRPPRKWSPRRAQVHLVDAPFEQPLGWRTAREVWSRQVRWARLRRVSFPWLFAPELFVGAAFPAAAAGIAAAGFGANAIATVAGFLLLWFGAELGLAYRGGWRQSLRFALALPVRDLLLPVLWVAALSGPGLCLARQSDDRRQTPPHRPARQTGARPADETSGSY